ncbi:hypothetical protein N9N13_04905 [Opitutales bacterium]|nr:hypothetical protein [Opitutales bacterium]
MTAGVFLTGFALLMTGVRLTNLGNLARGARGAKGAFLAILDGETKGALLLKPENETDFTLDTVGARGARGTARKAKH